MLTHATCSSGSRQKKKAASEAYERKIHPIGRRTAIAAGPTDAPHPQCIRVLYIGSGPVDEEILSAARHGSPVHFECIAPDEVCAGALARMQPDYDCILADYAPPKAHALLAAVLGQAPGIPLIFLGSSPGEEAVIEMLQSGAADFVLGSRLERLGEAMARTLRKAKEHIQRLKAEQALRQSEERFFLAMQGMNDGIWDYDLITGNIYYSSRYKAMLGYRDEEYTNDIRQWEKQVHPEDHAKAWEKFERYCAGDIPAYKDFFRMLHKNGGWRWILSRAIAVRDGQGRAVRVVGAHTDMTDQKELERELREAYSRAEAANNAKTEFLANMSHEIRTPMNAIIGLANILCGTGPLTHKQKQCMTTLQLSAESLLTLINDMLDIAKIEDNMIELEQVPFSIRELMHNVGTMMSVRAQEKGLYLSIDYASDLPDALIGDPLRIQQIVVNLVSNAIKFTHEGGVTVEVLEMKGMDDDRRKISLRVRDSGIGIPTEKLYSIFDKFTQADASITRRYGGSGLGLSISKALAERMGGNIHVASEDGLGSVFTVNLPLKLAPEVAGGEECSTLVPKTLAAESRCCILLVEDNRPNILVATTLLEEFGYSYEIAMDGLEALRKLEERSFDAVLMDIQMGSMDGLEATRAIREKERRMGQPPIPIIAMTAHALSGHRDKCLKAGMNDYISKPFNPSELQMKLAMALKLWKSAAA